MARCRIGLIGAGNVAQRHARVLAGFADVHLTGVTDVLPDACERLADQHAAPAYPDVATLLEADLDAVYVCVPPFAHGPAEEAVIAAGLPMFVEKPVAAELATAERIAGLVAERGILTAVGHHWRYLTVLDRMWDLLAGRPVRMVGGAWLDKVPPVSWWSRRELSGGPVVEQAAHVLDLLRLVAGEATEVSAYGDGFPPDVDGADIDSVTTASLRFTTGAVGTLVSGCTLGWKHRAGVEIVADGLVLTLGEDGLAWRDGAGEGWLPADPEAARIAVDRAFVDAVRGIGDDIRVPYPEALLTHRLACAVARSAATGRPVRIAPAVEALAAATHGARVGSGLDA
ncbi:Gfo/Idh/MocA family protein [Micromonospora sp. NBC_01796]|uniref:Gfo/Idh/MocA family protein n=1 Tax=Micromonospora sp. NBC_01796 TaxID=2975987 RepID=UPI002DDB59C8|nr:Gfo/Idh/MocA family oxidoreductase [Micromonospora sp. NBC_01796]WSA85367.1 Gfo/Idh/MocA family oxidoreductase [Micromonospora sp. NBC_01796]